MSFSFGNPTTTTATSTTGGFAFGAPPTAPATGSTPSLFSFGGLSAPTAGTAQTQQPPVASSAVPTFGALASSESSGFRSFAAPTNTASSTVTSATGTLGTSGGGFTFGTTAPTTSAAPAPTLGFGAPAATIGFGTPTVSTGPPPGLSLLGSAASTAPKLPTATSAPTFSLSAPTTTTAFNTGFSLGATTTPSATGLSLPASTTTTAAPNTGFSLGAPGGPPSTLGMASGFKAPTTTATTSGLPQFGSGTGLSFNSTVATTTTTTTTATSSTPVLGGLMFGTSAATSSTPAVSSTVTGSVNQTTNLGDSAALARPPGEVQQPQRPMTYSQLEEFINKWTFELEEQEKVFLTQATQVNAWDRILLETGDRIIGLNSTMENLKLDQQKLDLELDYIASQERELEETLGPLEKAVADLSGTDTERKHTYELASNLESTTKQMAEDLKEIIDHLNELNHAQDENNPIIQIGRILNAHMNSLQWIDQMVNSTQSQLEEANKMIEMMKKDAEHHVLAHLY